MTKGEAINWIINISADIGKAEHRDLWHYEQALSEIKEMLEMSQPEQRWIPCSETVDIPDREIMACDKYGEMMFGYLVYEDDQWLCESDGSVMYDPKAWCELPEAYKEGREG